MVDEALGDSFAGVLVSDFYAAYHHYDGPKQRCWVHLLRDIHDLKALYPKDQKLARWAEEVHQLWSLAKDFTHPRAQQRRVAQGKFERALRALLALCQPFLEDPRRRTHYGQGEESQRRSRLGVGARRNAPRVWFSGSDQQLRRSRHYGQGEALQRRKPHGGLAESTMRSG